MRAFLANLNHVHIRLMVITVQVALACIIAIFWLLPQTATFTIDATTETVSFVLSPGDTPPGWKDLPLTPPTDAATLAEDGLTGCGKPIFHLANQVPGPTTFTFTFTVERDALQLTIDGRGRSLGIVSCSHAESRPAPGFVVIRWPPSSNQPATLRIAGELMLGDEPSPTSQSSRVLRDGSLTVVADTGIFRASAASNTTSLRLGDAVTIFETKTQPALAFGIVRLEKDLVRVVAYAQGREAQMLRPGQEKSQPLFIAPTFWARVQAQSEWAIALGLLTLLSNFATSVAELIERRAQSRAAADARTLP